MCVAVCMEVGGVGRGHQVLLLLQLLRAATGVQANMHVRMARQLSHANVAACGIVSALYVALWPLLCVHDCQYIRGCCQACQAGVSRRTHSACRG